MSLWTEKHFPITKGLFREKVRHVGEENVGWYVHEHTACFKQVLFFIL